MTDDYDFYRIRHREGGCYWASGAGWVDRDESDLIDCDSKGAISLPEHGEWTGVMFDKQYHCEECNTSWEDTWTCACNDRCPSCDAEIEPEDYQEYDADQDLRTNDE